MEHFAIKSEDEVKIQEADIIGTPYSVKETDRIHTYEEALDFAGTGWYHYGLLFATSVCVMAMCIDMFGFSVIVTGCACDFQLTLLQKNILMSMPFIGPIFTAYFWGYIADTRGRKQSLLLAFWGSFILATLGAFSLNWIMLAVLKFFSTSLCSCAQSSTFALLGESCPQKTRGSYMLIMSSVLCTGFPVYITLAYFILNQSFAYDLGLIVFTQWRLLCLVLAIPLGVGAFFLHFFFESPKFLVNAGQHRHALKHLEDIWRKNGGAANGYPVKKIVLNEEGNNKRKEEHLLMSLRDQTIPLFKPPLLLRTLQLLYLTAVIYGVNNSFFAWFPFLAQSFAKEFSSTGSSNVYGMCNIIASSPSTNETNNYVECTTRIDPTTVYAALGEGIFFLVINLSLSMFAAHKKTLIAIILAVSCVSSAGAVLVTNNILAFILFFGLLFNCLGMGLVFSYFVDLYPTSYRGMAACLGVMLARISSLVGVNLVGTFIITHCSETCYFCVIYLLSGFIVSCFLPADKSKEKSLDHK